MDTLSYDPTRQYMVEYRFATKPHLPRRRSVRATDAVAACTVVLRDSLAAVRIVKVNRLHPSSLDPLVRRGVISDALGYMVDVRWPSVRARRSPDSDAFEFVRSSKEDPMEAATGVVLAAVANEALRVGKGISPMKDLAATLARFGVRRKA